MLIFYAQRCSLLFLLLFLAVDTYASDKGQVSLLPTVEDHISSIFPQLEYHDLLEKKRSNFRDRLLEIAEKYSKLAYVPYIWGGGRVGTRSKCLECRKCVRKNKVSLKNRWNSCNACRSCGIDCSHFVNKVYRESGLKYSYASTWELSRQTHKGLLKHYDFIDIGDDVNQAMPGDLLVYKKHITMLTKLTGNGKADFIHVTRFRWRDQFNLGGLRWDRNRDVTSFRGKLVRILRHRVFFEDLTDLSNLALYKPEPKIPPFRLAVRLPH